MCILASVFFTWTNCCARLNLIMPKTSVVQLSKCMCLRASTRKWWSKTRQKGNTHSRKKTHTQVAIRRKQTRNINSETIKFFFLFSYRIRLFFVGSWREIKYGTTLCTEQSLRFTFPLAQFVEKSTAFFVATMRLHESKALVQVHEHFRF